MKLIILKNNLIVGLNSVERAIGDNVNLPILKSFLVQTEGNKIVLTSTNLELVVKYTVSGKIMETGSLTIPFAVFNNIIKNLNSDRVTLENKEEKLAVSSDNYEAIIQGQGTQEFPIIPSIQNTKESITLKISDFKELLSSVVVATQHSDIRPEISGVCLQGAYDTLVFVATDSFRLAEKKVSPNQFKSSLNQELSAIIPLKTAVELLRVLNPEDDNDSVEILVDPSQILFRTNTQEITSRLIDGRFPEYQPIIPKETQNEVVVNRAELTQAVKLTSAFSGRLGGVILKSGDTKKFLEIYAADDSLGENRYRLPIKLKGNGFAVSFNWRYLLDGLRIYKSEEVVLGVGAADRPATVKSINDPSLIYVLMPIKS